MTLYGCHGFEEVKAVVIVVAANIVGYRVYRDRVKGSAWSAMEGKKGIQ